MTSNDNKKESPPCFSGIPFDALMFQSDPTVWECPFCGERWACESGHQGIRLAIAAIVCSGCGVRTPVSYGGDKLEAKADLYVIAGRMHSALVKANVKL